MPVEYFPYVGTAIGLWIVWYANEEYLMQRLGLCRLLERWSQTRTARRERRRIAGELADMLDAGVVDTTIHHAAEIWSGGGLYTFRSRSRILKKAAERGAIPDWHGTNAGGDIHEGSMLPLSSLASYFMQQGVIGREIMAEKRIRDAACRQFGGSVA